MDCMYIYLCIGDDGNDGSVHNNVLYLFFLSFEREAFYVSPESFNYTVSLISLLLLLQFVLGISFSAFSNDDEHFPDDIFRNQYLLHTTTAKR